MQPSLKVSDGDSGHFQSLTLTWTKSLTNVFNCFHHFLVHTNQAGEALEAADEGPQSGFQLAFLGCSSAQVPLSHAMTPEVLGCTNEGSEGSLQKGCRLDELQRYLWCPRCILLCGKGIGTACLSTFRTGKENVTPL